MNKTVHPELFKGTDLKSDPIQIPIKPCCNLVVESCLVTFPVLELAYNPIRRYSSLALGKISKLALVGYYQLAHTVRFTGFFCMCISSMRSHVMAKLEGDAFERASDLESLSTNPFQLCHPHYLVVIGKASNNSLGAHNHA